MDTLFAHRIAVEESQGGQRIEGGTQLAVYSRRTLGAGFQTLITSRLAGVLRGIGARVERVVVRFEDLNGPKGGTDTACRIQLVLSGMPALVVEARADGEAHAFRLALPRLAAALTRQRDRKRTHSRVTLREASNEMLVS